MKYLIIAYAVVHAMCGFYALFYFDPESLTESIVLAFSGITTIAYSIVLMYSVYLGSEDIR